MSLQRTGTEPATDLSRHRLGIAATFATQGLLFISVTTRLPRFQERWDLTELFVALCDGAAAATRLWCAGAGADA